MTDIVQPFPARARSVRSLRFAAAIAALAASGPASAQQPPTAPAATQPANPPAAPAAAAPTPTAAPAAPPAAPAPMPAATRTIAPGPAQTTWDTFLHEGPGQNYQVIDEVSQGQAVTVLGCDGGWCKVTYEKGRPGYLLAEVVATTQPAEAAPGLLPQPAAAIIASPAGPCFEAMQTEGNGGTAPTTFCHKKNQ